MFQIFLWSFISGFTATIAAEASRDVRNASKDYEDGVQRSRRQREVTDLINRS